ncbi:MAG: tetratricopeptide repeat protein [Geobacter sp.]|nr:tetratricopeptide repeat protein [Geobacter sp.]
MVHPAPAAAYPGPVWIPNNFCKLVCLMLFGLLIVSGSPALAATSSSLPPAAQVAVNKGKSADRQHDYLAAIEHFQKALRIAPNAPEVLFYLGVEESKVSGRELRSVAWLGAYLSLRADGPGAAKVKDNIGKLKIAHRIALLNILKDVEKAAQLAERNDKGPSLRDVARKLAEIGDFTSALQIAANLADLPESQAEAYGWIAQVQLANSDIAGALKTASLSADGQPAKDDTLLRIVGSQIASDRVGALETIARIQDPRNKDRAKRVVSYFQARTDDVPGALNTVEAIQDADIQASAWNDISHVQVDAGDLAGALNTAILIPAVWDGNAVLQHISITQARKGDIDGALKTAALYNNGAELPLRIAKVQAEGGDLAGALNTVALIEKGEKDHYIRGMVQVGFARWQMTRGIAGGVRKTLASARQSAKLVTDAGRKETVLTQIALILAESGDVAGALALAGQIESASWKVKTQSEIAVAQAKRGDVAGALKTVDLIKFSEDWDKGAVLVRVAEIQAKAGKFAGALRTARLIHSTYNKAYALRIVAELQVKRGDVAGAQKTVRLIQDETSQNEAQKVVDAARFKAGDFVTLWRQRLEDSNLNHYGALNTAPFLDLPRHLQSLPSSEDPKKYFGALYRTCIDLIDAERIINELLEKQALK